MTSRRALVIGGTGFLGRQVVNELLGRNIAVTLFSRTEVAPSDGITPLCLGTSRWGVDTLAPAMAAAAPDLVLHLAGARHAASIEDYYEANTFLAERIMAAHLEATPEARLLLVGSAAEHGIVGHDGLATEDDACLPSTPYGVSKHAQTLHGLARARGGQPIVIARLFNPVGPGMPSGLAFADFARRIATEDHLSVGNLDVSRDFLSVREAARIVVELSLSRGAIGHVVNVCSGVATPIRFGLELMIAKSGRQIQVARDSTLLRLHEVPSIRGSTQRLQDLGIEPATADIRRELYALMDSFSQ
jgi:nucleoside-diphosphate-sugar epimerase